MEEQLVSNVIEQVQQEAPEQVEQQPQEQPQHEERYQSRNFRELREQAERSARERDELQQRLRAYEAQLTQQQQNLQQQSHMSDDDFIDYKTLKQELQSVRSELNEYKSTTSKTSAESRLRYDFPDIESVVTSENFKKLQEREPHLAATIANGSDVYTAGAAAYRAIMGLGIINDAHRDYTNEKKLAVSNAQRPRPISTVQGNTDNPLARGDMFAPAMTAEQRNQKYQQMRDILDRR